MSTKNLQSADLSALANTIKNVGQQLGFQQIAITDTDLSQTETKLQSWLANKFHGEMNYMQKHGSKRTRPAELLPGTIRVITARIDYLPAATDMVKVLNQPNKAYISRYATGRDYHKLIRKRLNSLAKYIRDEIGEFGYRAFADSAPVMEKPLAAKAGLGWIGKHTNLINKKAGSWFFLGEIYTDLPLPIDQAATDHCGSCRACIDICPTQAIVAPYQLDARRCISYLTIELRGAIPEALRPLIGNRIYGCDDCQICCPWNKFAKHSVEDDFKPRDHFTHPELITLFNWTEAEFLKNTEGSAIRRIGYECWLRNIAVALGNAPTSPDIIQALQHRANHSSDLVQEHVHWALKQHAVNTNFSH